MTLNTKKAVPKDLIDSLLADYKKPEEVIAIIRDTADETSDGRRKLINPLKAIQKL